LFKSKTYQKVKKNLVILLQPRIVGTTLENANLIESNLKRRDDFVDKNFGGEDALEDTANDVRKNLEEAQRRGKDEPMYDYRNNNDDEVNPRGANRQESELDLPKRASAETRRPAPPSAQRPPPPPPPPGMPENAAKEPVYEVPPPAGR